MTAACVKSTRAIKYENLWISIEWSFVYSSRMNEYVHVWICRLLNVQDKRIHIACVFEMDMIDFIGCCFSSSSSCCVVEHSMFMFNIKSFNIIIIRNKIILNSKSSYVIKLSIGDRLIAHTLILDPIIWLKLWDGNMPVGRATSTAPAASKQDQLKNNTRICINIIISVRVSAWKRERLNYTITHHFWNPKKEDIQNKIKNLNEHFLTWISGQVSECNSLIHSQAEANRQTTAIVSIRWMHRQHCLWYYIDDYN